MTPAEFWKRECAAAALAGLEICPEHKMPCWVCTGLTDVLLVVREVTDGYFNSAIAFSEDWSSFNWDSPTLTCIHRWTQLARGGQ